MVHFYFSSTVTWLVRASVVISFLTINWSNKRPGKNVWVTSAGYKKHFGVVSNVTFSLHAGNQSRDKMRSGTGGNVETARK